MKNIKECYSSTQKLLGFDGEKDEMIEFGGILLEKDNINDYKFAKETEIGYLIKPNNIINNSHIHGITNKMCEKDGIEKIDMYNILKGIFGDYRDTLVIAHNAPFDIGFVVPFMKKFDENFILKNDILDTLEIAKDRTGLRKGNKLCDMIVRYEIKDEENSHRAVDDTKALKAVLRAMALEANNIDDYIMEYKGE